MARPKKYTKEVLEQLRKDYIKFYTGYPNETLKTFLNQKKIDTVILTRALKTK